MAILFEPTATAAAAAQSAIGPDVQVVDTEAALVRALESRDAETLVVFGPDADAHLAFDTAAAQRVQRPTLGVVLVRRRVDASVLAQAMRAGVREVVKADDLEALAEACRRSELVAAQVAARTGAGALVAAEQSSLATVLTVFSGKGGCGKTTIATNVATSIATAGDRRVCLVDLDLAFGDVAITLQLFPERTLADGVPMAGHVDELGVRSIVTTHPSGVDTLLAPLEPSDAERISPALVGDLLHQLRRMYDVVVVDTPPAFTEQVLAALDVTDVYLLVTTLDIPALKNLKLTLEMLDMLGYPAERQRIVVNRSDARVGLTIADVEAALHRSIACAIPSSRDVPATVNKGAAIVLDQPRHPVSAAIRALALREVAPMPVEQPVAPKSRHAKRMPLLRRGDVPA